MTTLDSYTAADTFPTKLIQNKKVINKSNKIIPYHIQLYPTNICNLNCKFCSCANRNKKDTLSLDSIHKALISAWKLDCKAVTISGGGEPTLHPQINEIIQKITELKMKVGITTNGVTLENITIENLNNNVTWLRISHSDSREWTNNYQEKIANIVKKCPSLDWGFSYVITNDINYEMLKNIVDFSNKNNAAYVRIVSDLLNLNYVDDMSNIKEYLCSHNVDDSIVIYQGRKNYQPGVEKCLISLLKPVLNADGYIYACCGLQYSRAQPSLDLDNNLAMGKVEDLYDIYYNQKYFNGKDCSKCYYNDYNFILNKLTTKLKHEDFL